MLIVYILMKYSTLKFFMVIILFLFISFRIVRLKQDPCCNLLFAYYKYSAQYVPTTSRRAEHSLSYSDAT